MLSPPRLVVGLSFAVLPVLAGCNQTAAPPPGTIGSGAIVAINEAQATQARHRITSTVLNQAAGFDPTGLSGYAVDAIEDEQARIEEEQSRQIDDEVEKAVTEAEALLADSERLEQQKANAGGRTSRRKPTP